MKGDASPPLGDTLLRAIGAAAVAGLRRDAAFLDPLVERGLVEAGVADFDPASSPDPVGLIRDLGSALGAVFDRDPSLVGMLGIDALGLLTQDSVGPSGRVARAQRSERTLVVLVNDPVDGSLPVTGMVRARRGTLVRRLGGVNLVSFADPVDAIHLLLDLRDAVADQASLRAGVETGEVTVAGTDLFGPVVAAACMVAAAAGAGELLATARVREPLGEVRGVSFEFVPPRDPGEGDPIAAWSLHRS